MEQPKKGETAEEIAKRYNIDLKKLEKEQEAFAKQIKLKDSMDFSQAVKVAGFSNIFVQNKIISACLVVDDSLEIVEQKYFSEKSRFPYIPGFRAYRELPSMISCFHQLEDKPEVVFISGHGALHPKLGIASHFSIATGVPAVGIADELIVGEIKGDDILYKGKIIGKVMTLKEGSRPVYVSPGSFISLKSAVELVRKFVKAPHKMPEPLRLAHKYAKDVMNELFNQN